MTDISVIILVGKEGLHIKRCLEKLAALEPKQVFVVESQKGDATHALADATARKLGWQVKVEGQDQEGKDSTLQLPTTTTLSLIWHDWPKLQSVQFNWALDNLPIEGAWVLRLDADEYLSDELIAEIREKVGEVGGHAGRVTLPNDIAGVRLRLERIWQGCEIRHATNGIMQVRMFRRGKGRYLETLMDERLIVDGEVADLHGAFYDDSLMPLEEWKRKQLGYAKREAQQAIESMKSGNWTDPRKAKYYRLPPYFRAFMYFAIRYFLKGGILDGYAGWMWNFWQGLWYRCLVDREIGRMKKSSYARIHEMHKNDPVGE